jgi:hypothetical protein
MPLVQTRGAASAQGFGEFAQATVANYIEDVFSTYLYTGNSGTQSIVNGIDLSTKGGLVWVKNRGVDVNHQLSDTVNGMTFTSAKYLRSNLDSAISDNGPNFQRADSVGFTWGTDSASSGFNLTGNNYASWTFREQPKFFDVVTYTGTGSNTTIAHSLGSVPGSIIVKRTDTTAAWAVYHRSLANTQYLVLNTTAAAATGATWWNSTTPTSAVFSVGTDASVNASGATYVAYLFAHDAGGFGLTGTDNVISCGGYTGDETANRAITLGYEPQWILWKNASNASGLSETNWQIYDTMRGWLGNATGTGGDSKWLQPNTSSAEGGENAIAITPTGIAVGRAYGSLTNRSGDTYIYIAIRRGPMKVPTLGTSVFGLDASSAGGSGGVLGAITASDLVINSQRDPAANSPFVFIDRLRGVGQPNTGSTTRALYSSNTNAETTVDSTSTSSTAEGVNGANLTSSAGRSSAIRTVQQGPGGSVAYNLIRAPGFFDEVCYTGTGSATTFSHNLTVAPEMMIIKNRSSASHWIVYTAALGNTKALEFTTSGPTTTAAFFNNTSPTSSVFTVNSTASVNGSGSSLVAYLFATCAGVSKVGSYTGNGTTQTINCGFTGGARFVLIKRTDSTGDWYVWDSARGIVAGNDPYLLLNSAAAEVTSTDYIDTASTGFEISSTAPAAINANGGSFIFLAIS